MIHEEKPKEGLETPKEGGKKSISGVTEVLGKRLSKNILTIPLQSCSLLYYNTHIRARTLTKISCGRSYENYYFHIVDDRLGKKNKKNHLKTLSLKPQQAS